MMSEFGIGQFVQNLVDHAESLAFILLSRLQALLINK